MGAGSTGTGEGRARDVCSWGGGGGDLVSSMPGCVCPKVKEMGPI